MIAIEEAKPGLRVRAYGSDIIGTIEHVFPSNNPACTVEWDYMRSPRPGVWRGNEYRYLKDLSIVPADEDKPNRCPKMKWYLPNPKSPHFPYLHVREENGTRVMPQMENILDVLTDGAMEVLRAMATNGSFAIEGRSLRLLAELNLILDVVGEWHSLEFTPLGVAFVAWLKKREKAESQAAKSLSPAQHAVALQLWGHYGEREIHNMRYPVWVNMGTVNALLRRGVLYRTRHMGYMLNKTKLEALKVIEGEVSSDH